MVVNTAMLDGLDITPDNMWNFQIQSLSTENQNCLIEGSIVFRSSGHTVKYSFSQTINPGLNLFNSATINPTWTFSSPALKELFTYHKVLPQGTYQYCVSVTPKTVGGERNLAGKVNDCIYKQSEDIFSITLLEPENNAKLYEYNPMLTWIATYPFLNELTYRVRVAEIKEGQSTENAIARNNPIYAESNLVPNTIVYPLYAKPLELWQPYAWTVDAYYKGILLGGAQPWRFIIVDDSLLKTLPKESSHIDINIETGKGRYFAVGEVKLKYKESDYLSNELTISFVRKGKEIKKSGEVWVVSRGENFWSKDISDMGLRHNEEFEVVVEKKQGKENQKIQKIKYRYVNPQFVK